MNNNSHQCPEEGCSRPMNLSDWCCGVHSILLRARSLTTQEDLDLVRATLADNFHVYTVEERAEHRRARQLDLLTRDAEGVAYGRLRCLELGADPERIDAAIAEGTSQGPIRIAGLRKTHEATT